MAKKDDSIKITSKGGDVYYFYRTRHNNDLLIVGDKEFEVSFTDYGKTEDELMFYFHEDASFDKKFYPKGCILKVEAKKVEFPMDRKKEA